jgi:hypothetical protein
MVFVGEDTQYESRLSPFHQYAGRATVTYDTEDCARKAMLHLDGGFIDGQKVSVARHD